MLRTVFYQNYWPSEFYERNYADWNRRKRKSRVSKKEKDLRSQDIVVIVVSTRKEMQCQQTFLLFFFFFLIGPSLPGGMERKEEAHILAQLLARATFCSHSAPRPTAATPPIVSGD